MRRAVRPRRDVPGLLCEAQESGGVLAPRSDPAMSRQLPKPKAPAKPRAP